MDYQLAGYNEESELLILRYEHSQDVTNKPTLLKWNVLLQINTITRAWASIEIIVIYQPYLV